MDLEEIVRVVLGSEELAVVVREVVRECLDEGGVEVVADREYVRGDSHTNTIESFFSIIKRQVYGTHHAVSEAHLQRYVTEVAFKWNNRTALGIDDVARTNAAIRGSAGKRLTYRRSDEA